MTLQRFEHQGAAPAVGLAASIGAADLTFTLTSGTGYPTGATGRLFILVLDPGTPQEEKVLCSSRSGTTITVNSSGLGGRGYDGTIAASHSVGTNNVQHVLGAVEIDDDNDHIYTTTRDDHTQYSRTDGSRAVSGTQSFVSTTNSGTLAVTGASTLTGAVTAGSTVTASGAVQGTVFAATLAGNGRYVGQTNGSPSTGTFLAGDFANDPTNSLFWVCTAGGSPGTWVRVPTIPTWTGLPYNTNWADAGGSLQAGRYSIDGMGFVHVEGWVAFTGTITSGTLATVATLPPNFRPTHTQSYSLVLMNPTVTGLRVDVLNTGVLQFENFSGGSLVNPAFQLGTIVFGTT